MATHTISIADATQLLPSANTRPRYPYTAPIRVPCADTHTHSHGIQHCEAGAGAGDDASRAPGTAGHRTVRRRAAVVNVAPTLLADTNAAASCAHDTTRHADGGVSHEQVGITWL